MNKTIELLISSLVVVILTAFLLHEPLLMPMGIQMLMFVAVCVLFLGLAALLFREKSRDEREKIHKLEAGRISFIAGSICLLIGMVYGIFTHSIDPFLPVTLAVMILAKVLYRLYSDTHK